MIGSMSKIAMIAATVLASFNNGEDVMMGAPAPVPPPQQITTHRLNSTAVLIGVVVGPETVIDGDIVQYRVLIDNHDSTASVVDIRQAMCCKDANGRCQVWHGHQNQVVCHGIQASVDYRVTVVSVGIAANPVTQQVSQVLVPVRIRAGHIDGQHDADVAADPAKWEQFRTAALTALVHKEVDKIRNEPVVPAPHERLELEQPAKPEHAPEHHVALWVWIAIGAAAVFVAGVLGFIYWWYKREQARLSGTKPYHDPYSEGGALYLPL